MGNPDDSAKIIEVEVVERPASPPRLPRPSAVGDAPVHPLSAIVLVAVDNLWNVADWAAALWIVTIPTSFLLVAAPTFFIQKYLKKDRLARALGFALLLGLLAAIPTSFFGTPVGLAMLAWTGLNRLWGQPASGPPR